MYFQPFQGNQGNTQMGGLNSQQGLDKILAPLEVVVHFEDSKNLVTLACYNKSSKDEGTQFSTKKTIVRVETYDCASSGVRRVSPPSGMFFDSTITSVAFPI